ncbi:MAG TPA: hypothetical protein VHB47_00215 [Thermoanaerobaculia bacterium]|jgi:hypothetical protein|nr:hypothetical protein [Thermoanaerobaculia bacterium]
MEHTKHVAPPATATEMRRLLGITGEEMAAARRLLRLTAGKDEIRSSRPAAIAKSTARITKNTPGKRGAPRTARPRTTRS